MLRLPKPNAGSESCIKLVLVMFYFVSPDEGRTGEHLYGKVAQRVRSTHEFCMCLEKSGRDLLNVANSLEFLPVPLKYLFAQWFWNKAVAQEKVVVRPPGSPERVHP